MTEENKMTETEAKEFREAAKQIAYGVWKHNFRIANPQASDEERKKAWDEAREVQVKAGKKALQALQKAGFAVSRAVQ